MNKEKYSLLFLALLFFCFCGPKPGQKGYIPKAYIKGVVNDIYGDPIGNIPIRFEVLTADPTHKGFIRVVTCLLYTSPSPRDLSTSRMPSSA